MVVIDDVHATRGRNQERITTRIRLRAQDARPGFRWNGEAHPQKGVKMAEPGHELDTIGIIERVLVARMERVETRY